MTSLNDLEIEREDETSTLFRGASLTTTIMDLYMKSICDSFLQASVQEIVLKLLEARQSCEVNSLSSEQLEPSSAQKIIIRTK